MPHKYHCVSLHQATWVHVSHVLNVCMSNWGASLCSRDICVWAHTHIHTDFTNPLCECVCERRCVYMRVLKRVYWCFGGLWPLSDQHTQQMNHLYREAFGAGTRLTFVVELMGWRDLTIQWTPSSAVCLWEPPSASPSLLSASLGLLLCLKHTHIHTHKRTRGAYRFFLNAHMKPDFKLI